MTSDDTQAIGETFQPVAPEPTATGVAGTASEPPPGATPTDPVPAGRPKTRSGLGGWINVALGLAVAVAIGGVAFAAGRMTAPVSAAGAGAFGNPNGRVFSGDGYFPGGQRNGQGGPRAFNGAASIQGTVTAVTPTSVTIKTASGQEVTIALDTTTTYHQQSSATSSDVKTGGTVIVRLGFGGAGGGTQTGPTANDVTVVP